MKHVVVAAAVIRRGEKIFCACRGGNGPLAHKWEFPGGKLESAENGEQAVVREIREELSCTIAVDSYLMTVEHDYPTFHITMHAYACHLVDGEPVIGEHTDSKWLTVSELPTLQWANADIPIVRHLCQEP